MPFPSASDSYSTSKHVSDGLFGSYVRAATYGSTSSVKDIPRNRDCEFILVGRSIADM